MKHNNLNWKKSSWHTGLVEEYLPVVPVVLGLNPGLGMDVCVCVWMNVASQQKGVVWYEWGPPVIRGCAGEYMCVNSDPSYRTQKKLIN